MSKISKKQLNDLLALSTEPEIDLVKDNEKAYKVVVEGKKDKLMKRKSLDPILLNFINDMKEFVVEQKEFNGKVVEFMIEQKEFNQTQKEFNQEIKHEIKEIKQDIVELKDRVTIIENKVDKMDKRVATLETFHQKDIKK